MLQAQEAQYKKRNLAHASTAVERIQFDPRPTQMINEELYSINNLHYQLNIASHHQEVSPIMWEYLLPHIEYGNFTLDPQEKQVILQLVNEFYVDYHNEKLQYKTHNLCSALVVPGSENQSSDPNWHSSRRVIISASISKNVAHFQSDKARMNFLKTRLWGIGKFQTAAMRYGMENEGIYI
jgi:hypothetical protein